MTGAAQLGDLPELEQHGEDGVYRHRPETELASLEQAREASATSAPWRISRACSREYRALRTSGTRRISAIGLLVVHCTQGSTAAGAASWFANPDSRGSAHVVVDGNRCYRTLPPSVIPWGAAGVNGRGWHLEIAGFAEWTRAEWLVRDRLLRRAAFKLAVHSEAFKIPLSYLGSAELRAGRRGVITHARASAVFGGSHWDPGPGFPLEKVLDYARRYRRSLA